MKKVLYALSLCVVFSFAGCTFTQDGWHRSSGKIETKTFDLKDFTQVKLVGGLQVRIVQSEQYSVSMTFDSGYFNLFDVFTKDKQLIIQVKPAVNLGLSKPDIAITMPRLHKLDVGGATSASVDSFVQPDDSLDIILSGACYARADVTVKDLVAKANGSSSIDLTGKAETLRYRTNGWGRIAAFDCKGAAADAVVSGVGRMEVYAAKKLKAQVNGAGSIRYRGNPEHKKLKVAGLGFITEG